MELKAKKPKISYRHGIYMYVIYKSANLNDVGLYVGSAVVPGERVKKYKENIPLALTSLSSTFNRLLSQED